MDDAGSSAQRIRIGLTGLAFAFLLVLLGSAISRSGDDEDEAVAAAESLANDTEGLEPDEPLAKLGVAPGGAESAEESAERAADAEERREESGNAIAGEP